MDNARSSRRFSSPAMRSGVSMSRPFVSATIPAASEQLVYQRIDGSRALCRHQAVGILPAGRVTKRSVFPAPAAAAPVPRGRRPQAALSPSKRQAHPRASTARWLSVSAVPSGATVSLSPAWKDDNVHIALGDDHTPS